MPSTPITLKTERLNLRLADPSSAEDCVKLLRWLGDSSSSRGGTARVGMNTVEDVRRKHELHGPRAELCTRQPPPYGMIFITFLRPTDPEEKPEFEEGTLVGATAMSFRKEMPYPDIGYGVISAYQGKGYATEAGRRVLQYWQEVVGVRDIWAGTLAHNEVSIKTAEAIGLVRAGSLLVCLGTGEDITEIEGIALVTPGTEWHDYDANGNRTKIYPTIGKETEAQKNDPLNAVQIRAS